MCPDRFHGADSGPNDVGAIRRLRTGRTLNLPQSILHRTSASLLAAFRSEAMLFVYDNDSCPPARDAPFPVTHLRIFEN